MFEKLRLASATKRLLEEKLYEKVVQELVKGQRRDGLWAKALANSNGVEEKAKALYIQYRVQAIKDEEEVLNAIAEKVERKAEAEKQLKSKKDTEKESKETKQPSINEKCGGHHHWSDDYRTHEKIVIVCSECGDIHHGEGFIKCECCGAGLEIYEARFSY